MQKLFDYMLEQHGVTLLQSDMFEITEMVNKEQGTSEILKELQRAETIHPDYPMDMFKQLAIMQEEAGEVTKAVLDCQSGKDTVEHVVTELVQTAAMCMRMIKNLINTSIHDLPNSLNDYVEVKSILRNPNEYKEWTKVSRFLASGLFGVEIREINNEKLLMTSNVSKEKCPKCGAIEIDAMTPRTVYECGSSDYDQRPNTFIQSEGCKQKCSH